ncbi:MAG: GxxExxY protein [Planctomycetes bacterium]|nr:GxxExxY protein [Planctomycetota bacterium]
MREKLNSISGAIIDASIAVHRELGPGLLENAYEACLQYELLDRGFHVERQKELPVVYRGMNVDCGFRLDLLVDGLVVVELKSVERLDPIHDAQVLTYLKLTHLHLGLLINFNVTRLMDGFKRLVRDFPS